MQRKLFPLLIFVLIIVNIIINANRTIKFA